DWSSDVCSSDLAPTRSTRSSPSSRISSRPARTSTRRSTRAPAELPSIPDRVDLAPGTVEPHDVRVGTARRAALATSLASLVAVASGPAAAQAPPTPDVAQRTGEQEETIAVRMAFSPEADERLGGVRVRRLLKIELEGTAAVEQAATGSLAGDLIRVWIHAP